MRYVGILIMAGAVIGSGFYTAQCLGERLEILLILRRMVYHLNGRILHGNDALPEALLEVGERFSEQQRGIQKEPGKFFVRIAGRLEKEHGTGLSEIWREEVRNLSSRVSMRGEDLRNLLELGDSLGYADRQMQKRIIGFYLERADDSIAYLKAEVETKKKLYRSLGAAAGLFLIVFLL